MTSSHASVYLYDAIRTGFGRYGGALSKVRPDDLASTIITELRDRSPGLDPSRISEVVWGAANGAGEDNRNVARMASLLAQLPASVPGTTVNRLCGSSLDAIMMGVRQIQVNEADIIVAGGSESMSRAPWVMPKPERAFPAGNLAAESTTLGWRLVNKRMPKEWTLSLGECNELLAEKHEISREAQDAFALSSHQRAASAWQAGHFDDHVVQVPGVELASDEGIRTNTNLDSLAALAPAFRQDGTITAGNSSPLSDGAAGVIIGSGRAEATIGRAPLARIAGQASFALDPRDFGYAPVEAANIALSRAGISWGDVGAVELNEAFAAQSLACVKAWPVDAALVNQWGGAIALGHPLGASGARIVGTLARVLKATGARWGVAAICIGVGQGLAMVIENEGGTP